MLRIIDIFVKYEIIRYIGKIIV